MTMPPVLAPLDASVVTLQCPGCGRLRYFRSAELFPDERLVSAFHKPCPHCGDDTPLRAGRSFAHMIGRLTVPVPEINLPWIIAHLPDPVAGDDNAEIAAHFEADQSSRRDGNLSIVDDHKRLWRAVELLTNGELRTPKDYYNAAMIFQHGQSRDHYHLAFELARRAADAGQFGARWLAAAAIDRWLMSAGLPQKFGTQFRILDDGSREVWPIDPATTDDERRAWDVPPLEG